MKDHILIKIGFTISTIGIISIFFLSQITRIEEKDINYANYIAEEGELIFLSGVIKSIKKTESISTIEIEKKESIVLISYENIDGFLENDTIHIIGKVDQYNKKKEIIVEKIKKE